jgi:photosystem II stability/assembly factor-like uncharacterized protein
MTLFVTFLTLTALIGRAFGSEWALDTTSSAAIVCGVGTSIDDKAVAAAGANGVGAFVENWQNDKWVKKQIQAGMILDSAVTPSGNIVAASVWGIFLSTDNGGTFTTVEGVSGASQSANVWGENKENFGLVGNFVATSESTKPPTSISGVVTTTDSGKTWKISSNVPPGYARYGAFPSENVWYVSSGMWGSSTLKNSKEGQFYLNERFQSSVQGPVIPSSPLKNMNKGNTSATGWFGAVSKTTDGGNTWTQVFITDLENDIIYFNGISCSSESHCAVVGEGYDSTGNYKTVGYVTFDGGVTWSPSLTTQDVGLMQVKFISETEGWAAGTSKEGRNLYGQFYWTNDGGKTWALKQVSYLLHLSLVFGLILCFVSFF